MAVKAVVFSRNERIDDMGRYFVQRHPAPVAAPVFGQHRAVRRQQHRRQFRLGFAQVADTRRERNQHQHIEQHQRRQHQGRPNGIAFDEADEAVKLKGGKAGNTREDGEHAYSLKRRRHAADRSVWTKQCQLTVEELKSDSN